MKNIFKVALFVGVLFISANIFGQYIPVSYETTLNEITENFKTIRGATSLKDGKTSLRFLSDEKIILRIEHKKRVKTLVFIKGPDEEGGKFWMSGNSLTIDTIDKYEKDITKELENMLKISREEAKK